MIKSLKIAFNNVRIIGCYFHYMQALDRNERNLGLYKKENKEILNTLKNLGKIPFCYKNNEEIINKFFDSLRKQYDSTKTIE